ncbi:MAG TPA: acetyl-CoA C-acyltransferase [Blastocatellia bacterium]|jgi:acetyl-CoA acyltransferase|nr:acetyl-CoA C-acyltransferase [Blastocatellia bacterium]
MEDAVIVKALRTAVGKAPRGALKDTRPDDMAGAVIRAVVEGTPGLKPEMVEDVILGCAMPEAEQGMNVARQASWLGGLPKEAAATTVNRFCSSGLQAIAFAAERIMCGWSDCIIAGGTETMSLVPMGGHKIVPNPTIVDTWPDYYLNMGLTAENLAQKYSISREEADEFSLRSHQKAVEAIAAGRFSDEIVPLKVKTVELSGSGKAVTNESEFNTDEGPRADTSLEALGKLKPAFHARGTVTAGNSSQMSDGAAAAVVMSAKRAAELGLKPIARLVAFATAGVDPDFMGIGPVAAVPKALKIAGLNLDQIDLIELNEAFAAQALSVIKELGMDQTRVNVNGGAIALGHPLGCTGAKLTASILQEMKRRGSRYGMVTMCVGGGMGAAGIFESIN